ncbi:protein ImuB [Nostoc sp. 3335mG]|nr:protein ImuB [Nostoc sp. 3335mG]
MTRVASLYLPQLAIERLARIERPHALPEAPVSSLLPVDDDPGACSVPRGGGWRPGARWAGEHHAKARVAMQAASLPRHQQPSMRELGRRSEAAPPPFRGTRSAEAGEGPAHAVTAAWAWARPRILVETVGQREIVTAACPSARELGLGPGMVAAQARALVPGLDVHPAEPELDRALLDRLALHAVRAWTPTAQVSDPQALWLDLTGTTHLFGGEESFCRRLIGFCRRLGLTARVAIAGTAGAAHAMARFATRPVVIVPPGGEVAALAPLPLAALRLSPEALRAAARFGLDSIGDLLPMPRGPLARRLGMATITRLDQAIGRVAEPITGIVPFEAPVAERRLLEPIGTADSIALVIGDLVGDLVEALRARGLGARALDLMLQRVDGIEQHVIFGTARATRDKRHLIRLLGLRVDTVDPGLGIEVMRLTATRADALDAVPLAATFGGDGKPDDLAPLIDQLSARIGSAALFKVAPVESDVPERAVARVGPLEKPTGWSRWRRPARLLRRPELLHNVVALLPDAPPRRFSWRGKAHVVVAGDGPERVFGEWWQRDGEVWAVRDYYQVEDADGGRYWIFRRGDGVDGTTGDLSWHLHGVFG